MWVRKKGCKVQIKPLTKEVTNYSTHGDCFQTCCHTLKSFVNPCLLWRKNSQVAWNTRNLDRTPTDPCDQDVEVDWLGSLDHHSKLEQFCALDLVLKKKWLFGKRWLNSDDRQYSHRINQIASAMHMCLGRWRSRMWKWEEDACPWISGVFHQLCSMLILSSLLLIQNGSNGLFKLLI